jgi:hypothetical protein
MWSVWPALEILSSDCQNLKEKPRDLSIWLHRDRTAQYISTKNMATGARIVNSPYGLDERIRRATFGRLEGPVESNDRAGIAVVINILAVVIVQ